MARILVVEDDADLRDLIAQVLGAAGHRLELVADGAVALRRVVCDHGEFDVIVLDLLLPGPTGNDLVEYLHQMVSGRTPIVVLSKHPDLIAKVRESHSEIRVLSKNGNIEQLRIAVEGALRERERNLMSVGPQIDRAVLDHRLSCLTDLVLKLHQSVRRDYLTGLYNRARLQEDHEQAIARAARYGEDVTIALLDLDKFRQFNAGGLAGGDAALRYVARVLQRNMRVCDRFYRFGGDEFVVLLQPEGPADGARVVDRIREAIAGGEGDSSPVRGVTVSAGVTSLSSAHGPTLEDAIAAAEIHLRRAKAAGGNCVRWAGIP